ncbi:hypothetical protein [Streptomyces fragilis]|uniref:Secreted protein n=1 Tax=Streptomyces fragilis TaxID=67301 RepID=A0ABV2YB20_9ACTN|nr:hypothetical protein [Streptomyces fragilis]
MSSERLPSASPVPTADAGPAPAARRHRLLRVRAVLTVCALASTVLLTAACGDSCASTSRKGRSGGSSSCSGTSGHGGSQHNDYDDDDDYDYDYGSGSGSGPGPDDSSDSAGAEGPEESTASAEQFPAEARPGDSTQMLTVQLNRGNGPKLTAWSKDADGVWVEAFSTHAGESDADVPEGTYRITTAFGNDAAPARTTFTYRRVTGNSYQGLDLTDRTPLYGIVVDTDGPGSTLVHGHVPPGDADISLVDTDMEQVLSWLDLAARPRIAFIDGNAYP